MQKLNIDYQQKIIENTSLNGLIGTRIKKIITDSILPIGNDMGNDFQSFTQIYFQTDTNELYLKFAISSTALEGTGNDYIFIDVSYVAQLAIDSLENVKEIILDDFLIHQIKIYGQHERLSKIKSDLNSSLFYKKIVPDEYNLWIDTESAILFESKNGHKIFVAHPGSPYFQIFFSNKGISRTLNLYEENEKKYFMLKRVIN